MEVKWKKAKESIRNIDINSLYVGDGFTASYGLIRVSYCKTQVAGIYKVSVSYDGEQPSEGGGFIGIDKNSVDQLRH